MRKNNATLDDDDDDDKKGNFLSYQMSILKQTMKRKTIGRQNSITIHSTASCCYFPQDTTKFTGKQQQQQQNKQSLRQLKK